MNEPAPSRQPNCPPCAIVTGAAHGVGARLAHALAGRGVTLILADRDEIALARIRQELGAKATAVRCDVLDERSVSAMFDCAERALGHVDLLINAAGAGYVRALGVMRASREFARRTRSCRAYIVNLAATPDSGAASGGIEYAGSQLAFRRLSEGLARAIENPELKILTLDRLDDPAVISDLAEQLVNQLVSGPAVRKGGASPSGS